MVSLLVRRHAPDKRQISRALMYFGCLAAVLLRRFPCRMSANASAVFITDIMTKGWKGPFTGSAPRSDLVVLTGTILAGHQAESVRADIRRICNHPLLPEASRLKRPGV